MKTNLYVVRHAHSFYTPDERNRPLSESGLIDADRVTELLKEQRIDQVVSSPYKRALQTVAGIAKYTGREIVMDEGFKERVLSEKPVDDFNYAVSRVWEDFDFSWEGGESNAIAQKRGVAALDRALRTFGGKRVVVGTHGNIMVLIMNFFNKNYDYDFWKRLTMPDVYQLTFDGIDLIHVSRLWK